MECALSLTCTICFLYHLFPAAEAEKHSRELLAQQAVEQAAFGPHLGGPASLSSLLLPPWLAAVNAVRAGTDHSGHAGTLSIHAPPAASSIDAALLGATTLATTPRRLSTTAAAASEFEVTPLRTSSTGSGPARTPTAAGPHLAVFPPHSPQAVSAHAAVLGDLNPATWLPRLPWDPLLASPATLTLRQAQQPQQPQEQELQPLQQPPQGAPSPLLHRLQQQPQHPPNIGPPQLLELQRDLLRHFHVQQRQQLEMHHLEQQQMMQVCVCVCMCVCMCAAGVCGYDT